MQRYVKRVLNGTIPACEYVKLAASRHLADLKDGSARGLRFDWGAAQHICDFFGLLTHSKGEWAGQPFVLEPWQIFILAMIFGWKRADGMRRFRTAYNEVPRKNGKSTLAAGIGLYGLTADDEPGAEIYAAATKRDQAKITHGEATRMVKASASLRRHITTSRNNLCVETTDSKFEPLGADVDGMDGLNVHIALIDEVHAHKNRRQWDALETATGSRRQPLLFGITTAGFETTSICVELRDYAIKILRGDVEDDTFFAIIYTIDEGDAWEDPTVWPKANPNYGISVKVDDFERLARKAMESPAAQNNFRRKRLNEWTEQVTRWLPMDRWAACGDGVSDPVAWRADTLAMLEGAQCTGGLDLGSTSDLTALVLLFEDEDEGSILLPWFWVPEFGVQRKDVKYREQYRAWIRDGFVSQTDGDVADYDQVRADINDIGNRYGIETLAVDRLFQGAHLCTQLGGDGFDMVPFGQGYFSMGAPTKEFEERVIGGRIRHGNNPVLRWMASNVAVKFNPAGTMKPVKPSGHSGALKIDGIVAAIMALARAMVRGEAQGSVYEDRGVKVL